MYVAALYDPTLDDVQDQAEPEICDILDGMSDSISRQPKDASSKRFAVRLASPPQISARTRAQSV